MLKNAQRGFTLIEIMVVIAISGALFIIVFAGQKSMRSRAQFDAGVEQVVATIAEAHNEATAGVNLTGAGTGEIGCGGAAAPGGTSYFFAGIAWAVKDNAAGSVFQRDYYAATADHDKLVRNGASACLFKTETINIGDQLRVDLPGVNQTRRILFVRDDSGGVKLCTQTNNVVNTNPTVLKNFKDGDCFAPADGVNPITLTFSDVNGNKSQVLIDRSGLAKRLN